MSPEFQRGLIGNPLSHKALQVHAGDKIRLRSVQDKVYLHSHQHRIPKNHPEGKVSSGGQQVNGYPVEDGNNIWQIIAQKDLIEDGDTVRLRHEATGRFLKTHDVASPLTMTNMEITAVDEGINYEDTLWRIKLAKGKSSIHSIESQFQLLSVKHSVYLNNHGKNLPEWAFGQRELNGDRRSENKSTWWFVSEIVGANPVVDSKIKKMSFWRAFMELNNRMLAHNSALEDEGHPSSSKPLDWPFLRKILPFWEANKTARISLLGCITSWSVGIIAVLAFLARMAKDAFSVHRGYTKLEFMDEVWSTKHMKSTGFLVLAYALHYLPFFVMGRVLYLHHYLPAFMFSVMTMAGMLAYLERFSRKRALARTVAILSVASALIWFQYYHPIAYGLERTAAQMAPLKIYETWAWWPEPSAVKQ